MKRNHDPASAAKRNATGSIAASFPTDMAFTATSATNAAAAAAAAA
eukprot:CAMPEP_0119322602 /NCGR_PEP_ID=MMETSP1333-20130426/58679_1 /TAXON_ID=418940 /ORGANISM="Scyphosphaera apsteinii, Strain RCC1455" /LENGTH=45 /DNA_ID= /DNA_START= /DNA_END= /DNA_ORIENTATION=